MLITKQKLTRQTWGLNRKSANSVSGNSKVQNNTAKIQTDLCPLQVVQLVQKRGLLGRMKPQIPRGIETVVINEDWKYTFYSNFLNRKFYIFSCGFFVVVVVVVIKNKLKSYAENAEMFDKHFQISEKQILNAVFYSGTM